MRKYRERLLQNRLQEKNGEGRRSDRKTDDGQQKIDGRNSERVRNIRNWEEGVRERMKRSREERERKRERERERGET